MRFRVSSVEAFRQFELDDEAEASDLIARIRGDGGQSQAMAAGTAFHKVLELAPAGLEADEFTQDGFTFRIASDMQLAIPQVRELRASKAFMVDGEPIAISGQVDAIDGLIVTDHKTTSRFDPERYIAGHQWRLYLDIFGCDVFKWNVFEMAEREDCVYDVFALHSLEQYRYPGMQADCAALVGRFARFVRTHMAPA